MSAPSLAQQWQLHRRLKGAARRFVEAHDRGTTDQHLSWLGLMVSLDVQDAIRAGWDAQTIGAAVGIVDPPARMGLDDMQVAS